MVARSVQVVCLLTLADMKDVFGGYDPNDRSNRAPRNATRVYLSIGCLRENTKPQY